MPIKIDKKCFLTSLLILFFYLFPVLTSNVYYWDDILRVMVGYSGWSGDGRPVGELLYIILAFGKTIPDLFPFPFIISIVLTAVTFSILCNKFGNNKSILFAFCISPLVLSPLFVSNLHFRYDTPFMILAIIFAILPFCEMCKNKYLSFILGFLSLILSFSSYQVAVNIFVIFSSLELLMNFYREKSIYAVKCVMLRIVMFLTGYLIYIKAIIPNLDTSYYFNNYNKLINFDTYFFEKLIKNINDLYLIFLENINEGFVIFLSSLICIFIISIISMIFTKSIFLSVSNVTALIIVALISVFTSIFGICGIMLFGQNPVLYSRTYIGFGAAISVMIIPIFWINFSESMTRIIYFLLLISHIYMFSFGFTTHNVIALENNHFENIARMIINDINRTKNTDTKQIIFFGELKRTAQTFIASKSFPLIKYMLPEAFSAGDNRGQFILNRVGLPNIKFLTDFSEKIDIKECNYTSSNNYYSLCKLKNNILVLNFE